jgi:hypothetical protein
LKEQVLDHTILVIIQETIACFINDHVIPEDTEFHYNPRLGLNSATKDEHLYEICVEGKLLYNI